jgi:tetratricopeptide (TPR) repeat protein
MTAESRHTFKARLHLGTTAWEAEDYGEALEIFQDLLVDEPTFADLHNKVGLCHAMMGQLEEALESFRRAGELAGGYAEAHLNRGIILNELGHHDEAAEAFEKATRLDSRDGTIPSDVGNQIANAHAALGDLYQRARRPERAADQYRKALEVRPGYPDIRSKLADSLAEIGRPEEARVELEAALEAAPGLTGARVRLGVVLHQLGDTEGAIREWKRAHGDGTSDSRPRAYLASVGVEVEPRG